MITRLLWDERYRVHVIRAYKRIETDHFEKGCDPDSGRDKELLHADHYTSVLEAYRHIVGDPAIELKDIGTMDPNIYIDVKGKREPRVVENNTARGRFRCNYDRMENKNGRKPSGSQMEAFKLGSITLLHVTYELEFTIGVVGLDDADLAEFLGVEAR